jgi:alpha-tubulin suppressor-like RCC1 family protein
MQSFLQHSWGRLSLTAESRPLIRVFLAGTALALVAILIAIHAPGADATGATQVSAGDRHTCAVSIDGGVQCFGYSEMGQTGLTSTGPDICGGGFSDEFPCSKTARQVIGLESGVEKVSAGHENTCALLDTGGVECWGNNATGQLGNGNATGPEDCAGVFGPEPCATTPVTVLGLGGVGELSDIKDIAVGAGHACALTNPGGVLCWGANYWGQLGNGSFTGPQTCDTVACSTTPVQVSGLLTGVQQITAGASHSCALLLDGSIQCWGLNNDGELGTNSHDGPSTCYSSRDCSPTPLDVTGITAAQQVSAGGNHTCARTMTGGAECWGRNNNGQLGTGSAEGPENCLEILGSPCSDNPVDVVGLQSGVAFLNSSAADTACAVMNDGGVKCWGANNSSQLGIGMRGGPDEDCDCGPSPLDVMDLSDVDQVSSGGDHTCAVTDGGAVKCWGYKFWGATGDNTWSAFDAYATTPVGVIGFEGGTPTPSPVPPNAHIWGDLNCSGGADPVDALGGLRFDAGLNVSQGPDCLPLDQVVEVNGLQVAFADVDCSGAFTPVDPLKVLRKDAGLSVDKAADCPDIGEQVLI